MKKTIGLKECAMRYSINKTMQEKLGERISREYLVERRKYSANSLLSD